MVDFGVGRVNGFLLLPSEVLHTAKCFPPPTPSIYSFQSSQIVTNQLISPVCSFSKLFWPFCAPYLPVLSTQPSAVQAVISWFPPSIASRQHQSHLVPSSKMSDSSLHSSSKLYLCGVWCTVPCLDRAITDC